jgi:DNA-binding MarR family transcriptional regulator
MEEPLHIASCGSVEAGQAGVACLLRRAGRALDAQFSAAIQEYGLDLGSYEVLHHVLLETEKASDGVLVRELMRVLSVSADGIVAILQRLERDGWIRTSGAPEVMRVVPTRRTHSLARVWADASHWIREGALNGLSAEEIDQLASLLQRVTHNLDGALDGNTRPLVYW